MRFAECDEMGGLRGEQTTKVRTGPANERASISAQKSQRPGSPPSLCFCLLRIAEDSA